MVDPITLVTSVVVSAISACCASWMYIDHRLRIDDRYGANVAETTDTDPRKERDS